MSLAHAILGFLQKQNMTGYDLKTSCFDKCLAHLWPADQAHIYKTLEKLLEQDWITCNVEIQQDRPNRKVYSLTAAGNAELLRWLQCSQSLPTIREPLLVQLFFATQLPNEAIVNLLEKQLAAHYEKVNDCQTIKLSPFNETLADREQLVYQLIQELIMRREQIYIDWLKSTIELLQLE
ncbi:PadR family transcriptional regulator [Nostoc sp. TCL26-01]|uniref:PadR family transcriptional regulator n=1 Tax=Nostoc sp. TCL26-01 TaxID=2576904 RepID=UPI0015B906EF|nr:PadR family transcriptional regulator [Nostoc sp. TCL26-01]QLE58563.1 PadR family transcriptional regulator [Nostoc sp. TCL26-01]